MDSREQILASLRQAARPTGPRPEPAFQALRFDDPLAAFEENLSRAGGSCRRLEGTAELRAALTDLPGADGSGRLLSRVPGVASRPESPPGDPRELAGLELALLPGSLAVAESGAVWVTPADEIERAALFLAEQVVLVAPRSGLVHNLHEAYQRIPAPFPRFACFVSGPSKTADIEQALVIGAQGPRALVVLLVEDER